MEFEFDDIVKVNCIFGYWTPQARMQECKAIVLKVEGHLLWVAFEDKLKKGILLTFDDCIKLGIPIECEGYYATQISKGQATKQPTYKIGDMVSLYAKYNQDHVLVNICEKPISTNCTIISLPIIGKSFNDEDGKWDYEYCVSLPEDAQTGFIVDDYFSNLFEIDEKWKDTVAFMIYPEYVIPQEEFVLKDEKPLGMNCMNVYCNTFCEWVSEPNLPDGKFLCWECRTNPLTRGRLGY